MSTTGCALRVASSGLRVAGCASFDFGFWLWDCGLINRYKVYGVGYKAQGVRLKVLNQTTFLILIQNPKS
jgi:hypothetical protein